MTLQFPAFSKRIYWLVLPVLVGVAVMHDLVEAWLLHYHFYISESLLFKACWLPFPLLLLFIKRHHLAWLGLPFMHICLFAVIVHLVSMASLDHTYQFFDLLRKAIAEDLYKYILVYGSIAFVINRPPATAPITQLLITNGKQNQTVNFSEINYISADDPYIAIHTPTKKILSSHSLKAIAQELPENFIRVHRATIINMNEVDHFASRLNGDYDVTLKCGSIVRVSRTYSQNFLQRFSR